MTKAPTTITLRRHPRLRHPETAPLFDKQGRLLASQCDELPTEPSYKHPFRDFYRGYSARLQLNRSVFTPYDEAVPVSTSPHALELFRDEGLEDRFPRFRVAGARESYRLNPASIRVGILTAGGNAPGLNTVIDSVVKRQSLLATAAAGPPATPNLAIVGYRGGYEGLLAKDTIPLDYATTDAASLAAGSILGIRRGKRPTDEAGQQALFSEMARAVLRDQLDVLYVIGGNGTIHAAAGLCAALQASGVPATGGGGQPVRVVAAPKTMDNDINFTDVTFGFRSTVENAVEVIRRIHVEASACERVGVIELFGAGSGFVALHAAYASGEADYVLIPELMAGNADRRESSVKEAAVRLAERYRKNRHALLVVAEGASRLYAGAGAKTPAAAFEKLTKAVAAAGGFEASRLFVSRPAHLVRSTPPNAYDVDLCKQTGKLMVDAALAGFGRCVVCSWHGQFVLVPMETAVASLKVVDVGAYYFLSMMEKYRLPATSSFKPSRMPEEFLG